MGGEGKLPMNMARGGGIEIDLPAITAEQKDELYALFKERFIGKTGQQMREILKLDGRMDEFINTHRTTSPLLTRKIFMADLGICGSKKHAELFINYYLTYAKARGAYGQILHLELLSCRTQSELKAFYFQRNMYDQLMLMGFKLSKNEYRRIGRGCLRLAYPPNLAFHNALIIATDAGDRWLFAKLMRLAIQNGEYESAKNVAEARKRPLTKRELLAIGQNILDQKIGKNPTKWWMSIFNENPELWFKFGRSVVDALLRNLHQQTQRDPNVPSETWVLHDILNYSTELKRSLTRDERRLVRNQLWLEHREEDKTAALKLAEELAVDDAEDTARLTAMKHELYQFYLKNGLLLKADELSKNLGNVMSSRELYELKYQKLSHDAQRNLIDLLVRRLYEEVGSRD